VLDVGGADLHCTPWPPTGPVTSSPWYGAEDWIIDTTTRKVRGPAEPLRTGGRPGRDSISSRSRTAIYDVSEAVGRPDDRRSHACRLRWGLRVPVGQPCLGDIVRFIVRGGPLGAGLNHAWQQSLAVPADVGAEVDFARTGKITTEDGINTSAGDFTLRPSGFTTSQVTTTAVGSTNLDRMRLAVVSGIDAITDEEISTHGDIPQTMIVRARLVVGRLVIVVGGYELTFDRKGTS
jgi:hypothetical protein